MHYLLLDFLHQNAWIAIEIIRPSAFAAQNTFSLNWNTAGSISFSYSLVKSYDILNNDSSKSLETFFTILFIIIHLIRMVAAGCKQVTDKINT